MSVGAGKLTRAIEPSLPSAVQRVPPPSVRANRDYRELLNRDEIEILYVAVPHNLHAKIYGEVLEAGKDLLAEKPFGIDLAAREKSQLRRSPQNALSAAAPNFRFCRIRNGRSKQFVRDSWAGSWR